MKLIDKIFLADAQYKKKEKAGEEEKDQRIARQTEPINKMPIVLIYRNLR